jgi:CspA family cold shock protein
MSLYTFNLLKKKIMTTILRLLISLVLAASTVVAYQLLDSGTINITATNASLFALIFIACALSAMISPSVTGFSFDSFDSFKSAEREQGTVKWFNVSKGYGFVTRSNGDDIFVHFRSIRGEGRRLLREGQTIEFSVVDGEKGPQAEDVEPL